MEVTPLIDVVFVVLAFFVLAMIVTTRVSVTEVSLASAGEGASAGGEGSPVVVALTAGGEVLVDGEGVGRAGDGGLGRRIAALLLDADAAVMSSRVREEGVVLAPDAESRSKELLLLMDALGRAGLGGVDVWRLPAGALGIGGAGEGEAGGGGG